MKIFLMIGMKARLRRIRKEGKRVGKVERIGIVQPGKKKALG